MLKPDVYNVMVTNSAPLCVNLGQISPFTLVKSWRHSSHWHGHAQVNYTHQFRTSIFLDKITRYARLHRWQTSLVSLARFTVEIPTKSHLNGGLVISWEIARSAALETTFTLRINPFGFWRSLSTLFSRKKKFLNHSYLLFISNTDFSNDTKWTNIHW